jgi:hypothetical protein
MKYYYLMEGFMLDEECDVKSVEKRVMIGSDWCVNKCVCRDYSDKEHWVICDGLTIKSRKQKLEKLNEISLH